MINYDQKNGGEENEEISKRGFTDHSRGYESITLMVTYRENKTGVGISPAPDGKWKFSSGTTKRAASDIPAESRGTSRGPATVSL